MAVGTEGRKLIPSPTLSLLKILDESGVAEPWWLG
jgi:hypothetical protein